MPPGIGLTYLNIRGLDQRGRVVKSPYTFRKVIDQSLNIVGSITSPPLHPEHEPLGCGDGYRRGTRLKSLGIGLPDQEVIGIVGELLKGSLIKKA